MKLEKVIKSILDNKTCDLNVKNISFVFNRISQFENSTRKFTDFLFYHFFLYLLLYIAKMLSYTVKYFQNKTRIYITNAKIEILTANTKLNTFNRER